MARLPTVGGDSGNWGTVLNQFLQVGHNSDGTLNSVETVLNVKDYGAKGDGSTDDTTAIQNTINAIPAHGGVVYLPAGTYVISTTISIVASSVTLRGAGIDATTITTSSNITGIQVGNRQSDGTMRNFNHIFDLTVTVPSNGTSLPAILLDGGGRGTSFERVRTNGGTYGFELMDLDRCYFANLDANNPITAGIFCEVGKENTYGTITFINCSMSLSNNNTYGMLWGKNADQSSPNTPDRITVMGCLFFMTTGLTGCIGMYLRDVAITAGNVIGCLFEQNNRHFRNDASGSTLNFQGCTFLDANRVCTDVFYLNQSGTFTIRDCRFQQATNVFNGVSSSPVVCLEGKSNNQGNITNIFTGSFGNRMGTDTVFGGDANLVSGLDNQRFDSIFANHWRGSPCQIKPSSDGNNVIQFQQSGGTVIGSVDTTNKRFFWGSNTVPTSQFQTNGAPAFPLATKSSNYTITETDYTIIASGSGTTITLPTAVGCTGRIYVIKRSDASNSITVGTTSSQTIDGSTTVSLGTNNMSVMVQSDGTNWQVIGQVSTTIL